MPCLYIARVLILIIRSLRIHLRLVLDTVAVTFNDAAERAFQYLQNCNVLLKVKDNTFFEPYYGLSEDIVAFGKYRGKIVSINPLSYKWSEEMIAVAKALSE